MALEEQLKWKTRAVDLMLAIDRLRDSTADERELAAVFISTLADAVEAELCLLCLRDEDNGELQLRSVLDRAGVYTAETEGLFRDLAGHAAELTGATFIKADYTLNNRRHSYCLAAPLRVGDTALGALLLLNADRPFNTGAQELVSVAISQIDTALQHSRTVHELSRRQRELEVIYRIDRIRDQQLEFQLMLDTVLSEVCNTIEAEIGFLMLYNQAGQELELRAVTDRDLFGTRDSIEPIRRVAEEAIRTGQAVQATQPDQRVRSTLGVPLILRGKLIGVLGVINRLNRPAFTASDVQILQAIGSQMDTAIFESLQTLQLREAFGKCVGPQVMDRLLSIADRDLLSSERIEATLLFSDIRGFTSMSEHIDPELLRGVLNAHLSALTDLVLAYEGTLDKYMGDCVMCFFNAPERQADHALRAVRLALEMQTAHRQVMDAWRGRVALPPIGIGISTGETLLGNFGSTRRLEYTAIGADVNLAARLCGAAAGNQILISERTYAQVAGYARLAAQPPLQLKGIDAEVPNWQVIEFK